MIGRWFAAPDNKQSIDSSGIDQAERGLRLSQPRQASGADGVECLIG
jgi:hypothetical protein